MHSVICIARRTKPLMASSTRETHHDESTKSLAPDDTDNVKGRGLVEDAAEALLRRKNNLEQLVSVLARVMDLHQAVAPLQWICLVCLIDLHALETRVSDMFMIRSGCQVLHRCVCARDKRHALFFLPFLSAAPLYFARFAVVQSKPNINKHRTVLAWVRISIDTAHRRGLTACGFPLVPYKVHSHQLTAHGGHGAGLQGGGSFKRAELYLADAAFRGEDTRRHPPGTYVRT